jgi:RNA-directed DNA polymerase
MRNNQSSLREHRSCPVQILEGTGSVCHRTFGLLIPETHGCTADGKDELSLHIPTPVCDRVQLKRGLPTMRDRAMQALYLMALEPVAETTADTRSCGFRKERCTMDAVQQCHNVLRKGYSPEWILEGDIKGCFDHISHEWLLNNIPMDKVMLRKWLECGFVFNKQLFPTEEGTPQGGIISPTLANMALDGLQKILADKYKRRTIKGKHYSPMVNLIRYADDFIITSENREVLETEIKPLVTEFLAERGLTLSEEKTMITNINDGFDFLGFNIRKFKNQILTKPSKPAQKRFLEKVRTTIKSNKACKQESLIRLLNPMITGWGNYYQHGATRDAFHWADHQIFKALWQWAKRRHSKKGKRRIADKYWHVAKGKGWHFTSYLKKPKRKQDSLTLKNLSNIHFIQYTQIKGDANPFDPECDKYFDQRETQKMLVTLKGRNSLLYLWKKQDRKCPLCGMSIDRVLPWNVTEKVVNGKIQRSLVHDKCYKQFRKQQN